MNTIEHTSNSRLSLSMIIAVSIAAATSSILVTGCGSKKDDNAAAAPEPATATTHRAKTPGGPGTPGTTPTTPATPTAQPPPRATLAQPSGEVTGDARWAKAFGGMGRDEPHGIAFTPDNGIVVTGVFSGLVDFGPGSLEARSLDVFVTKYDAKGAVQWVASVGSEGEDIASGIAVDSRGNIIIVGWFSGSMTVGDTVLQSIGGDDIFVIKFDAKGKPIWARKFGGENTDVAWNLAIDKNDDIVVIGEFRDTINFGGGLHQSHGNADIYLMRLTSSGAFKWSKSFGDLGQDYGRTVRIDSRGDIVLGAEFSAEVDFGSGKPLVHEGNRDIVLAKFSADGTYKWAKAYGNTFNDIVLGLAIDPADNIVIGGAFEKKLTLGDTTLVSHGRQDAFVARFDPEGKVIWATSWGADRDDKTAAVTTDGFGNIIATGWFVSSVNFTGEKNGKTLNSPNGNQDVFVVKLAPNGKHLWSQRFGNKDNDRGRDVAATAAGDIALAGLFRFDLKIADQPLKSAHEKNAKIAPADVFAARLEP